MTTELTVLGWSVLLLIAHIAVQGASMTAAVGVNYNLSARDDGRQPRGLTAPRAKRALDNFLETYPAFIALALALAVANKSGGLGAIGAILWIVARAVYLPIYVFGVPVIRTFVWVTSVIGILLMLIRLLS